MDGIAPAKSTTRVQLELQERAFKRLSTLKDETEATTYAEVVRTALKVYEALLREERNGSSFIVRRADGSETQYRVF